MMGGAWWLDEISPIMICLLTDGSTGSMGQTKPIYIYIEVKDLIWTGCGVVIDET